MLYRYIKAAPFYFLKPLLFITVYFLLNIVIRIVSALVFHTNYISPSCSADTLWAAALFLYEAVFKLTQYHMDISISFSRTRKEAASLVLKIIALLTVLCSVLVVLFFRLETKFISALFSHMNIMEDASTVFIPSIDLRLIPFLLIQASVLGLIVSIGFELACSSHSMIFMPIFLLFIIVPFFFCLPKGGEIILWIADMGFFSNDPSIMALADFPFHTNSVILGLTDALLGICTNIIVIAFPVLCLVILIPKFCRYIPD